MAAQTLMLVLMLTPMVVMVVMVVMAPLEGVLAQQWRRKEQTP